MAFKFQNILNHRKLILDGHFIELSRVQDELTEINTRIDGVNNAIGRYKETFLDNASNITSIMDYNLLDGRYQSLLSELDGLLQRKEPILKDLEDKKAQIVRSKMEYEKIDRLREKYLAIDRIAELKRDEAIANDFASNRFNRNER